MKKILATLLIFTILLCGCSASPTDEVTLPSCFTSEAEITCGDTVYTAALNRYTEGWWQIEVLAPEVVKGLTFTIEGDTVTPGFKGLNFKFDTARFPAGSVIKSAVSGYDRLASLVLTATVGDESMMSSGDANGQEYTVVLTKAGLPSKMEIGDIVIEFTHFNLIEEVDE